MRIIHFSALLFMSAIAHGGPLLFDMGADQSALWPGFTRVTTKALWSGQAACG